MVVPISKTHADAWIHLRKKLWPDCTDARHRSEVKQFLRKPSKFAQFFFLDVRGNPVGFTEVSIRSEYVNGTETSPVAFLEAIYVEPHVRRTGIARCLVQAVSAWALERGISELASDADLVNTTSRAVHEALGFEETERVVYFRMSMA